MTFKMYAKFAVMEWVLAFASSWALAVTVMEGFWIDEALRFSWVTPVLCAVLLVACYLAAWKPSLRFVGVLGVLVVVVVVIGASIALSEGEVPWEDATENRFVYALCVVLCSVGCFALTRTLAGSAVFFVVCVFACSLMQAFYEQHLLAWALVVLVSSLGLVVWRNCQLARARVDIGRATPSALSFLTAIVPVGACVAVACGIWFLVIAPLQPQALDIELLTEYRTWAQVQVRGVSDLMMETDTSTTSGNLVDGDPFTTDDFQVDENSIYEIPAKSAPENAEVSGSGAGFEDQSAGHLSGSRDEIDRDSTERRWDAFSYSIDFPFAWVALAGILLLIALIIAYFLARRWYRGRRLEKFVSLPTSREQVVQIYLFLMKNMARIGFPFPEGATLSSWSAASARAMDGLRASTGVPFATLTDVYVKCAYGAREPADDEVAFFVAFYDGFWKAAREHLGSLRYFFKSFRLG